MAQLKSIIASTHNLGRTLGDKVKQQILTDINLEIRAGDFVALTGPSGSGKSTLLYLLGALDKPTSGEVNIDGVDTSKLNDDDRAKLRNEKLGFVFQFHFLLPEFTVLENIMIPMLRRGIKEKQARLNAETTLKNLDMIELSKRLPSEMSGGQQQRVSIARALAGTPRLLLADEPTGNLDSKNGALVLELFERLNREQGMTIVMVTHDLEFAKRAGRQVEMKDGRIVKDK